MSARYSWRRCFSLLSVLACGVVTSIATAQPPAAPAPNGAPVPAAAPAGAAQQQGDPRVLDQGPIHEAFAEPIALDAKARVVVNREPPKPINELPPEVKPDGDNVEWIPGYWMWSDEQLDFVWVSGVWREIPPGRRWVPGHWLAEANSFVWVSGFWAGADVRQVQMLPQPPATLEAGPSSPAPGENFFWVPGCWIWSNNAFAWRTGYWYAGQQNWVWVPDYYCYTPAGSIFVSGYWDRPLWNRGLLYAPVYWPARNFGYTGFYYRPRYAVNSSLLLASLFLNTRYNTYWFGNGGWRNNWYQPWWDHRGYRGYDPIFAYHHWHDGHRHDWDNHWRGQFDRHHRDWDHHWDGDLAGGPGRPGGGRPGGGRPGDGRPGGGRPGDGDGRPGGPGGPGSGGPGDGRPGGRGDGVPDESLVADAGQLSRKGQVIRVRQVTEADRLAARTQIDSWRQIRTARTQAEGSGGAGGSVTLPGGGATSQVGGGATTSVQPGTGQPGVGQPGVGRPGVGRPGFGRPGVSTGVGEGGNVQVGDGVQVGGGTQVGDGTQAGGGGTIRSRPGSGRPTVGIGGGAQTQVGAGDGISNVGGGSGTGIEQRTGYRGGAYRLPPAAGNGNTGIVPGVGVPGAQVGSPWGSRGPSTRIRGGTTGGATTGGGQVIGGGATGGTTGGAVQSGAVQGGTGSQFRTMPGRSSRYTPSMGQPGGGSSFRTLPSGGSFNSGSTQPSIGVGQPSVGQPSGGRPAYRPTPRNFGGSGSGNPGGSFQGGQGGSFNRGSYQGGAFQGGSIGGGSVQGGGGGQGYRSNINTGGSAFRSNVGGGGGGGGQSFRSNAGGGGNMGGGGGGGGGDRGDAGATGRGGRGAH
jgi:hypothetical protein